MEVPNDDACLKAADFPTPDMPYPLHSIKKHRTLEELAYQDIRSVTPRALFPQGSGSSPTILQRPRASAGCRASRRSAGRPRASSGSHHTRTWSLARLGTPFFEVPPRTRTIDMVEQEIPPGIGDPHPRAHPPFHVAIRDRERSPVRHHGQCRGLLRESGGRSGPEAQAFCRLGSMRM